MSQAFVKENDDNGMLHNIDPTVAALLTYLKIENRGKAILLDHWEKTPDKEIAVMSNGFSYFVNPDKQWEIIL